MIKVFIIDDSALVRSELKKVLHAAEDIAVIGEAENPVDAFEVFKKVGLPDVFILDIEMPKMDGLTFLQKISKQKPIPTIICSTMVSEGSLAAIDAMRMGAVDIVLKPKSDLVDFFNDENLDMLTKVRSAAKAHVRFIENVKRHSSSKVIKKTPESQMSKFSVFKNVIAIGASTGGVQTLEELFLLLKPNHPPIVVVQHIPQGFSKTFSKRLNEIVLYSDITEAQDGDTLSAGKIFIAPGGYHMEIKRVGILYKVVIKSFPKVNLHKPSVDVLFKSVAKEVGSAGVGILLTGMGSDGAKGLLAMKEAGAKTYVQDEASSIVYGMPKVAMELGAARKSRNIEEIAEMINNGVYT
jgi:two-component system chemotaxis response regulator CheB